MKFYVYIHVWNAKTNEQNKSEKKNRKFMIDSPVYTAIG